jgi:hypothetical protein
MKTVITYTETTCSKFTISPLENQLRIKICQKDIENKDIILAAVVDVIKNNTVPESSYRDKIKKVDNHYIFTYKGKKHSVIIDDTVE